VVLLVVLQLFLFVEFSDVAVMFLVMVMLEFVVEVLALVFLVNVVADLVVDVVEVAEVP
jgi:hypothetical protein